MSEHLVDVEAERVVLGSILLDNVTYSEAAQSLAASDFSLDSHRHLFQAMTALMASDVPVETLSLRRKLGEKIDAIGGVTYITSLTDGLPPPSSHRSSLAHHVRIVRDKAQLRRLIAAANIAISRADGGDELGDIAGGLMETLLDVGAKTQANHFVRPRDFMPEVLKGLKEAAESGGLCGGGLPTGLDPLDESMGGLRSGELITIGALPGAGKTALVLQILSANMHAGNRTGIFSLEMGKDALGRRFLSGETAVTATSIRHPVFISKAEWSLLAAGTAKISDWPCWVDDSGHVRLTELLARARVLIHHMKVKLILVDYLKLVSAPGRDPREEVGNVANGLRLLAKSENIPVVLLSQLRRPNNVNDVPTMIDLKESGDIEAMSHVVLLLHAPSRDDLSASGEDTIIIGKNRNGCRGAIPVTFDQRTLRFRPRVLDK